MHIVGLFLFTVTTVHTPVSDICNAKVTAFNDSVTASGRIPKPYYSVAVRSKQYFKLFNGDILYSKEYGELRVDDWGTFYNKKERALDLHIGKDSTYKFGVQNITFWVVKTKHPDKWNEYIAIANKASKGKK